MRVHRGFLGWGVFLVLVGAVPLAVRAGYLTADQIPSVFTLWPLILIGIGAGILLSRTRFAFLGGMVVAATFGLMVGGLLAGGFGGIRAGTCGSGGSAVAFPARDGSFAATSASVDVDLDCGNATVGVGPGAGWRVEGQDRDGTGPGVEADDSSLGIRSPDDRGGLFDALNDRKAWTITLPEAVPLDLTLKLNAGSSTVDLGGAAVDAIELDLNAGSATIDLGSVRQLVALDLKVNAGSLALTLPDQTVRGTIEANAGAVRICVPQGVALRLHASDSIVAAYDYDDRGLVKVGSTWETPGFDAAAVRIELDTRANAGSFSLNPEEGCNG
jgi:hypothetical protein